MFRKKYIYKIIFYFTDLCRGINCKHGAHCEQGLCICPTDCPSTEETLCATDMNTVSTLSIIHVHNRTQSEVDQSSLKDTIWENLEFQIGKSDVVFSFHNKIETLIIFSIQSSKFHNSIFIYILSVQKLNFLKYQGTKISIFQ